MDSYRLIYTQEMRFENCNVTIGDGRVTWHAEEPKLAFDFMLVNEKAR